MVKIAKRVHKNKSYYYLEHNMRKGKKISKKQLYLGDKIPKDIDKIKKKFMLDIYTEKWFLSFDEIKKNYSKHKKNLPISAWKKELGNFVVKFTYNTQRIEGSTLTLKQTANLLDHGITPGNRPIEDVKEAENHKKVFFEMMGHDGVLSMQIILFWHKQLFSETKPDIAGKVRNHGVEIGMSKFVPPTPVELELLLKELFDWYKKARKELHPVELAALVHLKFVTIHPFSDGNGRLSRLMMNFVLNKYGFPMLDIQYTKRASYYNALERTQIKKEENIFLQWFFRRYVQEYKRYLK